MDGIVHLPPARHASGGLMKALATFTTAALLASAAAPVDAARIRYRYDGVVTLVDTNENNVLPTVVPGSTFTGSLWFDVG